MRVLEARFEPPYEGATGLGYRNVPGMPRLASAAFTGEFPLARIDFEDAELPVRVRLDAFTPLIPLDADASGLPAAVLRYRVRNPGRVKAAVSIAFSINNPVGEAGRTAEFRQESGLAGLFFHNPFLAAADALKGSLVLGILDAGGELTYLRGWPLEPWSWTGTLLFWDDFSADGSIGPEAARRDTAGSLCVKREIPAGASADYTFVLVWHFHNRTPERCGWAAPKGEEKTVIVNGPPAT